MKTDEVIREIRRIIALHKGDQRELYEELLAEAEGWKMWLEETEDKTEGGDE